MQSAKWAPVFMNEHPAVILPFLGITTSTQKGYITLFSAFLLCQVQHFYFCSTSVACCFFGFAPESVKTEEEKPFNPKGPQGKRS